MRFIHEDDFINMICKTNYYIFLSKDGYAYLMRPMLYDTRIPVAEETTQAMA
uniref:Uncharacterized protein n=1 Tax=Solanum lycopersicum TaxID=4081 RepID=A0A3Q7J6Q5_SOLLC